MTTVDEYYQWARDNHGCTLHGPTRRSDGDEVWILTRDADDGTRRKTIVILGRDEALQPLQIARLDRNLDLDSPFEKERPEDL